MNQIFEKIANMKVDEFSLTLNLIYLSPKELDQLCSSCQHGQNGEKFYIVSEDPDGNALLFLIKMELKKRNYGRNVNIVVNKCNNLFYERQIQCFIEISLPQ